MSAIICQIPLLFLVNIFRTSLIVHAFYLFLADKNINDNDNCNNNNNTIDLTTKSFTHDYHSWHCEFVEALKNWRAAVGYNQK